jgi:hypothetical protein
MVEQNDEWVGVVDVESVKQIRSRKMRLNTNVRQNGVTQMERRIGSFGDKMARRKRNEV